MHWKMMVTQWLLFEDSCIILIKWPIRTSYLVELDILSPLVIISMVSIVEFFIFHSVLSFFLWQQNPCYSIA